MSEHSVYQSYLLRFQRSPGSDQWRVTLQDVHTQQVLRFSSAHELMYHLYTVLVTEDTPLPEDLPTDFLND